MNGDDFDATDYPVFLTGVNMVSPVNRTLYPRRLLLNQYYYLVSVGARTATTDVDDNDDEIIQTIDSRWTTRDFSFRVDGKDVVIEEYSLLSS